MKYVPDTSALIEKLVSKFVKKGKIKEGSEIIIHLAAVSELEHQANLGKEIGFVGLEEINELRKLAKEGKINLKFAGRRPTEFEKRHAKAGEIDALIRDLAKDENATLITLDLVEAEVAKALGIDVIYVEKGKIRIKNPLEKFFDEMTMSVHIREGSKVKAKKGTPANWSFVEIGKVLKAKEVEEIAKKIVEIAKLDPDSFIETESRGSTIVQLKDYRIVITKPPFSDGWEITAVRPIRKMKLEDYDLPKKLFERFKKKAEGILIAGSPGAGKSTFAQALAEFYASMKKVVKTVEAPRDLRLSPEITQYSKTLAKFDELRDVLLLTRPDYTIFDELRNPADFDLFVDMRLAGIGMIGVIHATEAIDAVQRFVRRVELGMIPSIIDTVIFIEKGKVAKVYELKMVVKVPSGMTERDLARPVVEVRDFLSNQLEYEIYTFGEQTIVVPIKRKIEGFRYEIKNGRVFIYVKKDELKKLKGKKARRLKKLEKKFGMPVEVIAE